MGTMELSQPSTVTAQSLYHIEKLNNRSLRVVQLLCKLLVGGNDSVLDVSVLTRQR